MTEQEWLKCTDWNVLYAKQITKRQKRLFAVACCRHIQYLMIDPRSIGSINIAERFADRKATRQELKLAYDQACDAYYDICRDYNSNIRVSVASNLYAASASCAVSYINSYAQNVIHATAIAVGCVETNDIFITGWKSSDLARFSNRWQLDIFRHITGNPFQPKPNINISTNVKQLVTAMYEGENCHFALHDALLDANYPDLADHFKCPFHPKGCWVLDLLK